MQVLLAEVSRTQGQVPVGNLPVFSKGDQRSLLQQSAGLSSELSALPAAVLHAAAVRPTAAAFTFSDFCQEYTTSQLLASSARVSAYIKTSGGSTAMEVSGPCVGAAACLLAILKSGTAAAFLAAGTGTSAQLPKDVSTILCMKEQNSEPGCSSPLNVSTSSNYVFCVCGANATSQPRHFQVQMFWTGHPTLHAASNASYLRHATFHFQS